MREKYRLDPDLPILWSRDCSMKKKVFGSVQRKKLLPSASLRTRELRVCLLGEVVFIPQLQLSRGIHSYVERKEFQNQHLMNFHTAFYEVITGLKNVFFIRSSRHSTVIILSHLFIIYLEGNLVSIKVTLKCLVSYCL